ncbi:MAG: hypothetical protein KIT33_11870 [Candidatus Kapabacteria bacterium]|nr:hypothetical protein [Ignavibacteriota bacterium]MCW5885657.1 hypothetical protein [Candidatus Kapabacteria bacterium]
MKFLIFVLLLSSRAVLSSDWTNVHTGPDSISAFVHFEDKVLLFNVGGKITEVDLNDFSSKVINIQDRWIFSSFSNNNDIYMSVLHPSGTMPSILKSTDNGLNWSEFLNDFGGNIIFITGYEFFGNDTCIFVGSDLNQNSFISFTYDGGLTSNYLKLNNVKILNSISKANSELFIGSGNGQVLTSTDFGKNWKEVDYFNQNNSSAVRNIKFEGSIGIVSNQNGEIYKSEDYGENWRKVETGLSGNFSFFNTNFIDNKIIISGKNNTTNVGILLFSNDSGNTWNILFESDEGFRGTFIHQNFLYCISNHRNLWQADFNTVSVENEVINNSIEMLSIVVDNRILNTNINIEYELLNNLIVTDILGNNIGNDNFKVLSQHPLSIDIKSNVLSGVYFLRINSGTTNKVIKFLVL